MRGGSRASARRLDISTQVASQESRIQNRLCPCGCLHVNQNCDYDFFFSPLRFYLNNSFRLYLFNTWVVTPLLNIHDVCMITPNQDYPLVGGISLSQTTSNKAALGWKMTCTFSISAALIHTAATRENPHMQQSFRPVQRAPITLINIFRLTVAVRIYCRSGGAKNRCILTFWLVVWLNMY